MGRLNELSISTKELFMSIGNSTRYSRFNKFIHSSNLIYIGSTAILPHGLKKHQYEYSIFARFVRALINHIWLNLYPNAVLTNDPIFGFDHGPILNISTYGQTKILVVLNLKQNCL